MVGGGGESSRILLYKFCLKVLQAERVASRSTKHVAVSRVVITIFFKALALTDAKNKGSVKRSTKASRKNHCQTKHYHSLHMNRHVSFYNMSQKANKLDMSTADTCSFDSFINVTIFGVTDTSRHHLAS